MGWLLRPSSRNSSIEIAPRNPRNPFPKPSRDCEEADGKPRVYARLGIKVCYRTWSGQSACCLPMIQTIALILNARFACPVEESSVAKKLCSNGQMPNPAVGSGPFNAIAHNLGRWGLAAVVLSAIAYGSLIPFRFDVTRLSSQQVAQQIMTLRDTSAEDVALNVALYAVLAVALCRGQRNGKIVMFAMVIFCTVLSVALESLQITIPQRVCSGTDVLLNVLGACLGVIALRRWRANHALGQAIFSHWHLRPLALIATALSCGLLAYDLLPFDFITSTAHLHSAFQRIHPFEFPTGLAALSTELSHAFVFTILGFVVAVDAVRGGVSPIKAVLIGSQHGLVLACLIECLQIFTNSHVAELFCVATRSAAALLGAWIAVFVAGPPFGLGRLLVGRVGMCFFLFAAVLLQLIAIGGGLSADHHPARPSESWALPFYSLWLQPAPLAAVKALSITITAAILSGTLLILLSPMRIRFCRACACLLVMSFYFGSEFFRAALTRTPFDPTTLILTTLACLCVVKQAHWLPLLTKHFNSVQG